MKTILLILTIAIGIIFPFTHNLSFLIKYLLMVMLFFSFLKMNIKIDYIKLTHIYILIFNLLIPILLYLIIKQYNLTLAIVVFITSIAPTAIASPIIINLLNGKIEFTIISIIITNFAIAFILPFVLPYIINSSTGITSWDILFPVLSLFLIPFSLANIIKIFFPKVLLSLSKFSKYIFYLLVININLGTSKASYFIKQELSFSDLIIYQIAISSLLLCFLNFFLGRLITPSHLKIEGGQSLGQKNNGFTVWLALTFISPLAVLGPVFYILFQNIYISWQLNKHN